MLDTKFGVSLLWLLLLLSLTTKFQTSMYFKVNQMQQGLKWVHLMLSIFRLFLDGEGCKTQL